MQDSTASAVQTHLGLPELPPYRVDRPRLADLLDVGADCPLTLVSAPAGGGKSTLIASWARSDRPRHPVLWVAGGDREEPCIWNRLAGHAAAAGLIDRVDDPYGAELGKSPGTALQRLDSIRTPVIAVLDDLPDTWDQVLLDGIEHLVERGQGQLRLMIACRADPPLPLLRWRTRGLLTHVRADQLAFTLTETAALLVAHGVTLGDSALLDLQGLTEGWPAATRLAALSMQGHLEPERFVPEFAVHDRAFAEYLTGEVLDRIEPETRVALLRLAVVDYATPELLEALAGDGDDTASLDALTALEQANLCTVHYGPPRPWYRVHPLLGLLAYNEQREHSPDALLETHLRAADWYRANDMPADAIRHALAARAWTHAAATVQASWPSLLPGGRARTHKAIVPVPPYAALNDPWLALACAAERLDAGDLAAATTYLHLVERSRHRFTGEALDRLRTAETAFHLVHAYHCADPDFILETVRAHPTRSEPVRAFALLASGAAYLYQANGSAAEPALTGALEIARRLDLARCRAAALRQLAVLHAFRGSLRVATAYANELLTEIDVNEQGHTSDAAWAELALAEVCYQQDRLRAATYHIDRAIGTGSLGELAPSGLIAFIDNRIRAATGDRYAAAVALATARRQLSAARMLPVLWHALTLAEVDLRLATGQSVMARRLLDEAAHVPRLRVWTALSRAKLYLAERRPSAAAATLLPELQSSHWGPAWTVEAQLVYAEALAAQGDRSSAGGWLEKALQLAVGEGIRRPFVARGRAAYDLLTTCQLADAEHRRFADELAAALTAPLRPNAGIEPEIPPEPLTERELTVLRYLQSMLSTAEIASVLYVSVNTVKTHVKSIYRKLGTGRRRDAVDRARELHLL